MGLPLYQVDTFTDRPFSGSPVTVCLLPGSYDPRWLQEVAAELCAPITAFVRRRASHGFDLQLFTPHNEVSRHAPATLAAAHLLWETRLLTPDASALLCSSGGPFTVEREGDRLALDIPAIPPEPCILPDGLVQALGAHPTFLGISALDYLAELDHESTVRALEPDFHRLALLPMRAVMVTAPTSAPGCDFVARFFAPAEGVPEDTVTIAAYGCLGPFWAERFGKTDVTGYQASARGAHVAVHVEGDLVRVSGQAVTVWRGELL